MKYVFAAAVISVIAATPAFAEEIEVGQSSKKFSSKAMTAKVGDTIVFRNDDDVAHNVYSATDDYRFNLDLQEPGQSSSIRLDKAGEAKIRCAVHPKMKLDITVN